MSNHGILLERNISEFSQLSVEQQEEMQRQVLLKDHIDMYYNNNYVKTKKKKNTKSKRAYSKKPGARCKLLFPSISNHVELSKFI